MATGFAALVQVRARAARKARDAALDLAVERFIQRRGGPNKIDGSWPGPAEDDMKKHKKGSTTRGPITPGTGRGTPSPSGGAAPRPSGGGAGIPAPASGAPLPHASVMDGASYRARVAAMGLDVSALGEQHQCNEPRGPGINPAVQAAQEAARAAAEKARAERIAGLPAFDGRTASVEQVRARLDARGIQGQPADVTFRRPPPRPPPASERKPGWEEVAEQRRALVEGHARRLLNRMARGERVDTRRLNSRVFAALLRMKYGADPTTSGQSYPVVATPQR